MAAAEAWDVIHNWLDRNYPEMRQYLNGPADPVALDALEAAVDFRLPASFRASYAIHDGSAVISGRPYRVCRVIAGLPLLPTEGVRRAWEEWSGYASDTDLVADLSTDIVAVPEAVVRRVYADRGWVPFAGEEGHYLALDFAPGPRGSLGQVISVGRDDETRRVVAPSFTAFLEFLAGLFATGGVARDGDTAWALVVRRTGRDLLRSLPELFPRPDGE